MEARQHETVTARVEQGSYETLVGARVLERVVADHSDPLDRMRRLRLQRLYPTSQPNHLGGDRLDSLGVINAGAGNAATGRGRGGYAPDSHRQQRADQEDQGRDHERCDCDPSQDGFGDDSLPSGRARLGGAGILERGHC